MSKNKKQQRKFDKILEELCKLSFDLATAAEEARIRTDGKQFDLYTSAQSLVCGAIELVDPGCNPRYTVIVVKKVSHE